MDHHTQLPASEPQQTDLMMMQRRRFAHWTLAGAVGLALSACGGGGGDGNDSGKQTNLLDVYNKLEDGMGPDNVTELVGRVANSIGGGDYVWTNATETLAVFFGYEEGKKISSAYWYNSSSQSHSKIFKRI